MGLRNEFTFTKMALVHIVYRHRNPEKDTRYHDIPGDSNICTKCKACVPSSVRDNNGKIQHLARLP